MEHEAVTVFRVVQPIPCIGARAGDYLIVEPSHPTLPFVLQRSLPLSLIKVLAEPDAVDFIPLQSRPFRRRRPAGGPASSERLRLME
jgi:hypothetical protein